MRLIKTLQAQNKSAKFEPLIETQLSAPYLCDTFKNSKNKSNGLSSSSFSKSHRSSSPFRRPLSRRLSRSEDNLLSAFTKEENISFKNNCYNNLHDSRDKYSPILKDCSIGSGKASCCMHNHANFFSEVLSFREVLQVHCAHIFLTIFVLR